MKIRLNCVLLLIAFFYALSLACLSLRALSTAVGVSGDMGIATSAARFIRRS